MKGRGNALFGDAVHEGTLVLDYLSRRGGTFGTLKREHGALSGNYNLIRASNPISRLGKRRKPLSVERTTRIGLSDTIEMDDLALIRALVILRKTGERDPELLEDEVIDPEELHITTAKFLYWLNDAVNNRVSRELVLSETRWGRNLKVLLSFHQRSGVLYTDGDLLQISPDISSENFIKVADLISGFNRRIEPHKPSPGPLSIFYWKWFVRRREVLWRLYRRKVRKCLRYYQG